MPFYALPSGASPVLAGDAPPTGGVGQDGDVFIDRTGKVLYGPKASGAWPTGIDLSNGAPGNPGATGPTGASVTGPTGPSTTGPTGVFPFEATGPTAPTGYPAGTAWLNTDTGRYFIKHDEVFVEIGVQGEPGSTGATGPGFVSRGNWSVLESYLPGDTVYFGTSSYVAKIAASGLSQFPPNGTYWQLIASGSVTGPAGPTGPASTVTGPAGPAGTERGLNLQTVTGNITLAADASQWQILTPDTDGLEITLPTGISAGFDLRFANTDDATFNSLILKTPAGVTLAVMYSTAGVWCVWDGEKWRSWYIDTLANA